MFISVKIYRHSYSKHWWKLYQHNVHKACYERKLLV